MAGAISEDTVQDGLPIIYPDEGIGRDKAVTLYYRLKGEPYLVPVSDTVTVRASEYDAEAVIAKLAEGPDVLLRDLTEVLPPDTHVLKISMEKDIAYVTLSEELFGGEGWTVEDRRMSICAIVNSLCTLSGISRVQVWDSVGKRLTAFQYGFDGDGQQLLGPLGAQDDVVITPEKLVARAFYRLAEEEYTYAYDLFAESEPGGGQKPSYATFETRLKSVGRFQSVHVYSVTDQPSKLSAEAVVDIIWEDRDGVVKKVEKAALQLVPGERYKLGYYSLLSALGETP